MVGSGVAAELMLLGFVSLFLTVFQPKVAALCMPEKLNRSMLPCRYVPLGDEPATEPAAHRRLFAAEENEEPPISSGSGTCSAVSTSPSRIPSYCQNDAIAM
jgi:mlo protein